MLAEAAEDLYGYEIAKRLTAADVDATAPFKQGALYPVLRNMSAAGLLSSRVVPSYAGPPRRYYRITPLGRDVLAAWVATWTGTRAFVDTIVRRNDHAGEPVMTAANPGTVQQYLDALREATAAAPTRR